MKILLITIGTRGDCEPFIALGQNLKEWGNEVLIALPEQYVPLANQGEVPTFSLGSQFLDLINSEDARRIMASGGMKLKDIGVYLKMWRSSKAIRENIDAAQHEVVQQFQPDKIIFHPKATYVIPHCLTHQCEPIIFATTCGIIHPIKGMAAVGFNRNFGERLNKLTYKLTNWAMAKSLMATVNRYFKGQMSFSQVHKALLDAKIIYNASPNIVAGAATLPQTALLAGFVDMKKHPHYTPSRELEVFLTQHTNPIFITFGSMINNAPEQNTEHILHALTQLNLTAIINTSQGGLVEPTNYDKQRFHFVNSIPYDYIFPKVYAVIHHGGTGTTHNAIKYGCATMVIPHAVDQPMWSNTVFQIGLACKGLPISKLRTNSFAEQVKELYNNPKYRLKAEEIATQIAQENTNEQIRAFLFDD